MQQLSKEKDRLTNTLQIAIKIIETNGLLTQLQAQVNLEWLNQISPTSATISSAGSNSAGTSQSTLIKSSNSTNKINKQLASINSPAITPIEILPSSTAKSADSFSQINSTLTSLESVNNSSSTILTSTSNISNATEKLTSPRDKLMVNSPTQCSEQSSPNLTSTSGVQTCPAAITSKRKSINSSPCTVTNNTIHSLSTLVPTNNSQSIILNTNQQNNNEISCNILTFSTANNKNQHSAKTITESSEIKQGQNLDNSVEFNIKKSEIQSNSNVNSNSTNSTCRQLTDTTNLKSYQHMNNTSNNTTQTQILTSSNQPNAANLFSSNQLFILNNGPVNGSNVSTNSIQLIAADPKSQSADLITFGTQPNTLTLCSSLPSTQSAQLPVQSIILTNTVNQPSKIRKPASKQNDSNDIQDSSVSNLNQQPNSISIELKQPHDSTNILLKIIESLTTPTVVSSSLHNLINSKIDNNTIEHQIEESNRKQSEINKNGSDADDENEENELLDESTEYISSELNNETKNVLTIQTTNNDLATDLDEKNCFYSPNSTNSNDLNALPVKRIKSKSCKIRHLHSHIHSISSNSPNQINNNFTSNKSSRSNSIDQLIAAAAVTAQSTSSSPCSILSPSSPQTSLSHPQPVSTILRPPSISSQQSQQNLILTSSTASLATSSSLPSSSSSNSTGSGLLISAVNNSVDNDVNSLSRKNLNTIVEAIKHVEGNYYTDEFDSLNKIHSQKVSTSQDQASTSTLASTSASSDSNSLANSSPANISPLLKSIKSPPSTIQQQQKPPKKRKYTTEDISQTINQEPCYKIEDTNKVNVLSLNQTSPAPTLAYQTPTMCYIDINHVNVLIKNSEKDAISSNNTNEFLIPPYIIASVPTQLENNIDNNNNNNLNTSSNITNKSSSNITTNDENKKEKIINLLVTS